MLESMSSIFYRHFFISFSTFNVFLFPPFSLVSSHFCGVFTSYISPHSLFQSFCHSKCCDSVGLWPCVCFFPTFPSSIWVFLSFFWSLTFRPSTGFTVMTTANQFFLSTCQVCPRCICVVQVTCVCWLLYSHDCHTHMHTDTQVYWLRD